MSMQIKAELESKKKRGENRFVGKKKEWNIMRVIIKSDCFSFTLMDDTGLRENPLLSMNIK